MKENNYEFNKKENQFPNTNNHIKNKVLLIFYDLYEKLKGDFNL